MMKRLFNSFYKMVFWICIFPAFVVVPLATNDVVNANAGWATGVNAIVATWLISSGIKSDKRHKDFLRRMDYERFLEETED